MGTISKEIIMMNERRIAFSPTFGIPYGQPTKSEEQAYRAGEVLSLVYGVARPDDIDSDLLLILEKIK
jgi:hypothetical protein